MKRRMVRLAHDISFVLGFTLRKARAVKQPRVLMYHSVGNGGIPADAFRAQLDFIRREFEPVALSTLLHRYRQGLCTGREVAVTFDDGVRNHLSTAYPLLKAAGVPATFFLCPGLMDSGQWIWNMEARSRLRTLDATERKALAARAGWPTHDVEGLIAWAKTLPLVDRREGFEQVLRAQTARFTPSEQQSDLHAPLSWDEARMLDPKLITIGSHTMSHPILTTLSPDEQVEELTASRARLENKLDREVDIFCYPNGDNDDAVVERVRGVYRWAVTTEEALCGPGLDFCRLPRVPAAPRMGLFVRRMHQPTS